MPFHDIGRIYDFPDLRRVFKERAQALPVVFPTLDAGWVLLMPDFGEETPIFLGFFPRDSGIDFFGSAITRLRSL